MSRKLNIINFISTIIFTIFAIFLISYVLGQRYSANSGKIALMYLIGLVISIILCSFIHELGHFISARRNGFSVLSFTFFCFSWHKVRKHFEFRFVFPQDSGMTEIVPNGQNDVKNKFKKITRNGLIFSVIPVIIGALPLVLNFKSFELFVILSVNFPVGIYFFVENIIPSSEYGIRNDGAVLLGIKLDDDTTKTTINLLIIQSLLNEGKSPKEIDEKLYYDLPQLPEDDRCFALILYYRYLFELDRNNYKQAGSILDRMISLENYIPKNIIKEFGALDLFRYCTYSFNSDNADEILFKFQKFFDNTNTVEVIMAKLAYILFVRKENDNNGIFYNKALKEIKKCPIKGLRLFYKNILETFFKN